MPELPARCPMWSGPGGGACKVAIHHWRPRKTGPRFPVAVVRCGTHGGGAFTLYPPSYAPYRRQPVMQVAPDGSRVHDDRDGLRQDFGGTVFEAALDAEGGQPWPRETSEESQGSWGTQGRRLGIAAQVLGLLHAVADRVRESIAAVLSVDVLLLRDGSRAKGYRGVGTAVCSVLERLRGGTRRALHLLFGGHLAGRWGEPMQWDPECRLLERLPFRAAGASPAT